MTMAEKKIQAILGRMKQCLQCAICLETVTNPVTTNCGHTFCRFCMLSFLAGKKKPCPLCKKSITKRGLMERGELGEIATSFHHLIDAFQTDTGRQYSQPRASQMRIQPNTPEFIKKKRTRQSATTSNKNSSTTDQSNPATRRNVRRAKKRTVLEDNFDNENVPNVLETDDAAELLHLLEDNLAETDMDIWPQVPGPDSEGNVVNGNVQEDCNKDSSGKYVSVQSQKSHSKHAANEQFGEKLSPDPSSEVKNNEVATAPESSKRDQAEVYDKMDDCNNLQNDPTDSPDLLFSTPMDTDRKGELKRSPDQSSEFKGRRKLRSGNKEVIELKDLKNEEPMIEDEVGLTPDAVDETECIVQERKVGATYSRKNRAVTHKKQITKQKVSDWLKSSGNHGRNDESLKSKAQSTVNIKSNKKSKKIVHGEEAMGLKMKRLADKIKSDETDALFGFEDIDPEEEDVPELMEATCTDDVQLDVNETVLDDQFVNKLESWGDGVSVESVPSSSRNLKSTEDRKHVVTADKAEVEDMTEGKHIAQKPESLISGNNIDEENTVKPLGQKRRIFKSRGAATNVSDSAALSIKGVSTVSVSADEVIAQPKDRPLQSSQNDPYAFKSSQPTPVKGKSNAAKKRKSRSKTSKSALKLKDKKQDQSSICLNTTGQHVNSRPSRIQLKRTSGNSEQQSGVVEVKKGVLKKLKPADKEVQQMSAMLNQAEEHDLLTCTQDAMETLPKESTRKVTFKEPEISDFLKAGKIDMIAYRKAKAKFASPCKDSGQNVDTERLLEPVIAEKTDIVVTVQSMADTGDNSADNHCHKVTSDAVGRAAAPDDDDDDDDLSEDYRFHDNSGSETDELELEDAEIDLDFAEPVSPASIRKILNRENDVVDNTHKEKSQQQSLNKPHDKINMASTKSEVAAAAQSNINTPEIIPTESPVVHVIEETPLNFTGPSLAKLKNESVIKDPVESCHKTDGTFTKPVATEKEDQIKTPKIVARESPETHVIEETPLIFRAPSLMKLSEKDIIKKPKVSCGKSGELVSSCANRKDMSTSPEVVKTLDVVAETPLIENPDKTTYNLEVIDADDETTEDTKCDDEDPVDLGTDNKRGASMIKTDGHDFQMEENNSKDTDTNPSTVCTAEASETLSPSLDVVLGTMEEHEELISIDHKIIDNSPTVSCQSSVELSESIIAPQRGSKQENVKKENDKECTAASSKEVGSSSNTSSGSGSVKNGRKKRKRKCFMLEEPSDTLDFGLLSSSHGTRSDSSHVTPTRKRLRRSKGTVGDTKEQRQREADSAESIKCIDLARETQEDVLISSGESKSEMVVPASEEQSHLEDVETVSDGDTGIEVESVDVVPETEAMDVDNTLEADQDLQEVEEDKVTSLTCLSTDPGIKEECLDGTVVTTQSPCSDRKTSASLANTSLLLQSPPSTWGTQISVRDQSLLAPGISQENVDPSQLSPGISQGNTDPSQLSPGISQGNTDPSQLSPGISQGNTDPSQLSPGISQGNTDPSQLSPGISQGNTDPSQLSLGISQGNTDPYQLSLGISQGNTDPSQMSPDVSQGNTDPSQMSPDVSQGNIDPSQLTLGESALLPSGEKKDQALPIDVDVEKVDINGDGTEKVNEIDDSQKEITVEDSCAVENVPRHLASQCTDTDISGQSTRRKSLGKTARGFSKGRTRLQDGAKVTSPAGKLTTLQTPEKWEKLQSPVSKFLSPKYQTQKLNVKAKISPCNVSMSYKGNSKYRFKDRSEASGTNKEFTATPEVVEMVNAGGNVNQVTLSPFAKFAHSTSVKANIDGADDNRTEDKVCEDIRGYQVGAISESIVGDDNDSNRVVSTRSFVVKGNYKDKDDERKIASDTDIAMGVNSMDGNNCDSDDDDNGDDDNSEDDGVNDNGENDIDEEELYLSSCEVLKDMKNSKQKGVQRLQLKHVDSDGKLVTYDTTAHEPTEEMKDESDSTANNDEDNVDVDDVCIPDSVEEKKAGHVDTSYMSMSPDFNLDSSPDDVDNGCGKTDDNGDDRHNVHGDNSVRDIMEEYEKLKQDVVKCLGDADQIEESNECNNFISTNGSKLGSKRVRTSLDAKFEHSSKLEMCEDDVLDPNVDGDLDDDVEDVMAGDIGSIDEQEKIIIEESDVEEDGSRPMNLTSSSAISSISEELDTQDRVNMEEDLERMAAEMKDIMEQMKQKKAKRGQLDTSHVDTADDVEKVEDMGDNIEVDDIDDMECAPDDDVMTGMVAPSLSLCEDDVYRSDSQGSSPTCTGQLEDSVSITNNKNSPQRPALVEVDTNTVSQSESELSQSKGFIASGLSMSQNMECMRLASQHEIKFSSRFHSSVSHVIVKPVKTDRRMCDRTLKFFQGVAHHCWIVSYSWVEDSLSQGHLLPEEDYEIEGDTSSSPTHLGPRRSRLATKPVFQGLKMALLGDNAHLPRDVMAALITKCGGHIVDLSKLGEGHHRKLLVVSCADLEVEEEEENEALLEQSRELQRLGGWVTVSRDWVLDSLCTYRRCGIRDYIITS